MGKKIICGLCLHQTEGFCEIKKVKVKPKKRRVCDSFEKDVGKVKISQPIPSARRLDWFWNREERRKLLKQALKQAHEKVADDQKIEIINPARNIEHPLTGDLSRFTTTAKNENEEKGK